MHVHSVVFKWEEDENEKRDPKVKGTLLEYLTIT